MKAQRPTPQGTFVRVTHLHEGNSSRIQRDGKKYRTIAKLVDKTSHNVIMQANAFCSNHDNPNRKLGRLIAVNRLLFQAECLQL
jgi:protein subunit release factor B